MPARILVIDNQDSFTWNLVQALASLGARVEVRRNDVAVRTALAWEPDGIVVSPGPGTPAEAGSTPAIVRASARRRLPLLGVCLGHQALALVFGGRIARAATPRHGKAIAVRHDGRGLLAGLPSPFEAMLYHSLIVDAAALPAVLEVSARGPAGEVMGLRHRGLPLEGVQFHPESIGTPVGPALLARFVERCRAHASAAPAVGAVA